MRQPCDDPGPIAKRWNGSRIVSLREPSGMTGWCQIGRSIRTSSLRHLFRLFHRPGAHLSATGDAQAVMCDEPFERDGQHDARTAMRPTFRLLHLLQPAQMTTDVVQKIGQPRPPP